jgi:hypothetical protein
MKEPTTVIGARVTSTILARIDAKALAEHRTRANVVSLIIGEYFDANGKGLVDERGSSEHFCAPEDRRVVHKEVGDGS